MRKLLVVIPIVAMMSLTGCSSVASSTGYNSQEPCCWCDDTPTKEFSTSDDEKCYLCKDCATTCFYCGEPAANKVENSYGMVAFVCDDCLDEG